MGDRTAFFYGTLMAPQVLYRVIYGNSKPEKWQADLTSVRPAMLHSYRRHRVKGADYPAVSPKANSTVRGSLVTGLTAGDIRRLDIFEGEMYERRSVKVEVLEGVELDEKAAGTGAREVQEVDTETYVWRQDLKDHLVAEEWDFEVFKTEKMRFWMGEADWGDQGDTEVDDGFADVDRAVSRGLDDPTGGRGANGHITRQLKAEASNA